MKATFVMPGRRAEAAGTVCAVGGGWLGLGGGAGVKGGEARAFGQPYPGLGERLDSLEEHFESISPLTRREEPPFDFNGRHAWVEQGVNGPATSGRDHIPLLIGGHGKQKTFRIAARFCDELNINLPPIEIPPYLEALHERCAEVGRDPATILLQWGSNPSILYPGMRLTGGQRMMGPLDHPTSVIPTSGQIRLPPRPELLAGFRGLGFGRIVAGIPGLANTFETLDEFIEDCAAAGMPIAPRVPE